MNSFPIVSFYKNGEFIVSDNYFEVELLESNWEFEIDKVQKDFYENMKIIQFDFPKHEKNEKYSCFKNSYRDDYFGVIYILKKYRVSSELDIINRDSFKLQTPLKKLVAKDKYIETIEAIKKEISVGNFYQINFTIPFKTNYIGDYCDIFLHYHQKFSGDYHALIPYKNGAIVSMSPELFLKKEGNSLISQPIKGTLPNTPESYKKILESKKEESELSMIVDLLRNDLNSVGDIKGDSINFHRKIMNLGNLIHTYSEIEVKTSKKLGEILKKTAPGGSISGCPKEAAIEAILKYEQFDREAYTGSIGWWQKDDFILNITIRSFILRDDEIVYHSGGGIVYDSQPEKEFEETLLKASKVEL
ncbi:chorismate-binding protein [bacterium]|nr:chorismate-binding protein [bacterium]